MLRKTIAALVFSALTMGSAQALTIDDFSVTQSLSDPGTTAGTVTGPTSSIIGGHRDAQIQRLTGADPATLSFNSGATGTMSIANGTGGTSTSTIFYDGPGSGGFAPTDLTVGGAQDAFDLRIIANDFAADITITVFSTSGISGLMLSSPGGIPGPSSIPLLFEYADFSGSADFTAIQAISLQVHTPLNATDIELDFFGTTTTDVPEPGALALLGLGLAGLGLIRRRRA